MLLSAILIASDLYACSLLKILIDMSASLKVSARLHKNLLHCNRFSESGRFSFSRIGRKSGVKIYVRFALRHCRADRSGRHIVACKPALILFKHLRLKELYRKCQMERKERIKAIWVAEQHVPTRTDCRFCDIDESNKKAPVLLSWIRSHATVQNVCNYRLSSPFILGWQVWAGIQTLNRFPCSNWGFWNCYRTIK